MNATFALTNNLCYVARQYSVVKDRFLKNSGVARQNPESHLPAPVSRLPTSFLLVGLGGIEPPTSPLSGVRSSHLSYRPETPVNWWSWSGSNRRPPECKSGALPAELQPQKSNRGQLDAETTETSPWPLWKNSSLPSGDSGARLIRAPRRGANGLAVS